MGAGLEGRLGGTHLLLQTPSQKQQLLHAALKAGRRAAREGAQRQRVSVQPGEVANYPAVPAGRLDSRSVALRLGVRLSPATQQTLGSSRGFLSPDWLIPRHIFDGKFYQ